MSSKDKFFLLVQLAVLSLLPIASLASDSDVGSKSTQEAFQKCNIESHESSSNGSCSLPKSKLANKKISNSNFKIKKKKGYEFSKKSEPAL